MACHFIGAKSSPEPMLIYCKSNPYKQSSVKFQYTKWWAFWVSMKVLGGFYTSAGSGEVAVGGKLDTMETKECI